MDKRHRRQLVEAARAMGVRGVAIDTHAGNGHARFCGIANGKPFCIVISGSPKDRDNALKNQIKEIRRIMEGRQ